MQLSLDSNLRHEVTKDTVQMVLHALSFEEAFDVKY